MEKKLIVSDLLQRQADVDAKRAHIKYIVGTIASVANQMMSEGQVPEQEITDGKRKVLPGVAPYGAVWSKGDATWFIDLQCVGGKDRMTGLSFYWDGDPKLSYDLRDGKYKFWADTDIIHDHLQFFVDKMSSMLTKLTGRMTDLMAHL
jgi:hypothetical protein